MYLRNRGATVEVTDDPERDAFRAAKGIGDDVASCHTAEVDGYLVEGHVPVAAITRLLAERPDAVGLALPVSERVAALEDDLIAAGFGGEDVSALARWFA